MPIKFAEIDLKQPLQPIYVDARYDRLFVLVFWGYLPLDMLRLNCTPDSRTFTAEYLKKMCIERCSWTLWENAVAGTLDRLNGQEINSPEGALTMPPISVVVCTRDRSLLLERCLESLAHLDYPTYEVVVVDNHSSDPRVMHIVASTPFRYVREDTPGLDWARNRGVKEARYDIIAFIDDDAEAFPGWLRGVAYGFEQSEVMAVTGAVMATEIETQAQNEFELYGGMCKGFTSFTVQRNALGDKQLFRASNWGVGANMAFRRALFDAVGDFDVALDVGTPTNGGGDIEFLYRIVSAGYTLRYEPAAMVRHLHRRDGPALDRQIYNNGRSFVAYLLTIARNQPHRRSALVRFGLRWWLWEWLLRRLFQSLVQRDKLTFRFATQELRGSLSGYRSYRQSRQIAKQPSGIAQLVNTVSSTSRGTGH